MRLKSFTAPTMAAALNLARQDQGDDTVIVATTEDPEAGGFRVSVAIETEEILARPPRGNSRATLQPIEEALAYHGVSENLASELLAIAETIQEDDPILRLAAGLDSHFHFLPLSDRTVSVPLLLIGPPGMGKTTAIAKLAASATIKKQPVTVITTDTKRAGAIEQLESFTKILGTRLHVAQDPGALRDLLALERSHGFTYIDSAGTNPYDEEDIATLKAFIEASGGEPVLVLSAGGDLHEMEEVGDIFGRLGVRRLLITRLDMARRLGGVLAAAERARLNLSNVSVTPKISESLHPINPVSLARFMMPAYVAARATSRKEMT